MAIFFPGKLHAIMKGKFFLSAFPIKIELEKEHIMAWDGLY